MDAAFGIHDLYPRRFLFLVGRFDAGTEESNETSSLLARFGCLIVIYLRAPDCLNSAMRFETG
jgi:hypothetical protein